MRISDWSSDVCSSDLERARKDLAHRGRYLGLPRPAERAFGAEFAQFEKGDPDLVERLGGGDEHRFGVAILHALRIAIGGEAHRSEEHTSELQSLMRISYAVFCLKKKKDIKTYTTNHTPANQQPYATPKPTIT